jgi:hypothetical protein
MCEHKVASLDELVAGNTVHSLVGGFAIVELSEPPTTGRGVLFESLTHELNVE